MQLLRVIIIMFILPLLFIGGITDRSKSEPTKPKPVVISMESHARMDRLNELRQDAWLRASRAQRRHGGRVEYRRIETLKAAHKAYHARIDVLKAAKEAEQARAADVNTEQRNIESSNSSKVGLSGIAACIAKYESGSNPTAQNPASSASGLYQFIDGTWNDYGGYSRAMYAPVSVQTEKFYQLWDNGRGSGHWVVAYKCGY